MSRKSAVKMFVVLLVVRGAFGSAVAQMPNPYGAAISVENAKKAAAPALAEATKNHWTVAVAIVGPEGALIYFEEMDNTQLLGLKGAVPIEGGIPLVMEGKIVGAIGVSGATSAQDAQCAKAGAETVT